MSLKEPAGRGSERGAETYAIGAVLLLYAVRFQAFLGGGVLTFRDAGYFFAPWREVFARQARAGFFPYWNDAVSCGRAMAANPNASVFWPLTPAVLAVGPTGLVLLNFALLLLLFFAAMRLLGLGAFGAAAGAATLLFSGVAQTLPVVFTTLASLAPLPIAVVALATLDPGDARSSRRRMAVAAAALGLSFLGGEPVIAAIGGVAAAAAVVLRMLGEERRAAGRRAAILLVAALLGIGLASVQLLPVAGELRRSARAAGMKAEHGALFWSVRPARVLTLLEPRLTGDPFAEAPEDYWGAGTFDGGNAYFYDLAIGLVPLALALASSADPRGRAALALAALGAVLSFGRFLPGYDLLAPHLSMFRYPEKWWTLATCALAAAAGIGVDLLSRARRGDEATEGAPAALGGDALRRLVLASAGLALPLAGGAILSFATPGALKEILWRLGLGAGATPAARLASVLGPLFLAGAATLGAVVVLAWSVRSARATLGAAGAILALLFLIDAGRRVAGTCPASSPEVLRHGTAATRLVASSLRGGRFYDDGAERAEVAVARGRLNGGFDPLRPDTGVFFGIRYGGENDIDRMTPARAFDWVRSTAAMPWGEQKAARLRAAGITVVRTEAPGPDPPGVVALGGFGRDRVLRLEGARPEYMLATRALRVPPGAAVPTALDPLALAVVESPGASGRTSFEPGVLEVLAKAPARARLRVSLRGPGLLVVARTFDPSWRARVDGAEVPLLVADGFLTALPLPASAREIELFYSNPSLKLGGALTAAAAVAIAALFFLARKPV